MEIIEHINRATRKIKKSFYIFILILISLLIIGEFGLAFNGIYVDDGMTTYVLETITILVTAASIPLALKLFNKKVSSVDYTGSIESLIFVYEKWFILRLVILGVAFALALATHYLCVSTTGSLCAILIGFSIFFCMPSKNKLLVYLDPLMDKDEKM